MSGEKQGIPSGGDFHVELRLLEAPGLVGFVR